MSSPIGVSSRGRYTRCVEKSAYANPKSVDLGSVFSTGFATFAEDGCDYLLGRKLVCLGGVRCAIGTIVQIEPVGHHKAGFDAIDNDFCVNLLLFPHQANEREFGGDPYPTQNRVANWQKVTSDGIQGTLILHDSNNMPQPAGPRPDRSDKPYSTTYIFRGGQPSPYVLEEDPQAPNDPLNTFGEVPVLHCECEGSRIYMVCKALEPYLDIARLGGGCRAAIDWIPFAGDAICALIEDVILLALSPLIWMAFLNAWLEAQAFDEDFTTGPVKRWAELNESVLVTGEWVWDGGHQGWNEIHPVHVMMKVVLPTRTAGLTTDMARSFVQRWCGLVAQVPPPIRPNGQPVTVITPKQQDTYNRQQRPENRWTYHPDVDGCLPRDTKPEVPIV
ncbi:hypothetical protein ACFWAY_17850 [Rhodococcus sp. NPDC059968]|uniref:hypothetical protein n=1 Tax=Rhodococcus sp. NPDC059968 TaxID=3347017 RepID=UPI00366E5C96